MIDIKLLQKDFDNVANALKRKGVAVGEKVLGSIFPSSRQDVGRIATEGAVITALPGPLRTLTLFGLSAPAVRQADRSKRKRAVAAGNALMQDIGEEAQILGNKVPDSGTAGNLITNNLLLGTAGGAGMGLISPWMIAIPGFSKMLYSDSGIKLFNKWLKSGQSRQALRDLVKKYSGTATSGLLTLQD